MSDSVTPWTEAYQAPPSMGFSSQEYWSGLPLPSPKKTERRRIDAFELWCCRRLLWVPWTARRSNQSILKEISPEYSLKGLMLKLKLQNFGHLIRRTDLSLEKTLTLGKIEGRRKRRWKRMRWLDGITDLMEVSLSKRQELVMDRGAWCATKSRTWLSNWTELNWPPYLPPEKSVCRSRSNSSNWTWTNRLVPNWERNTSRLYIVILLLV